MCIRVMVLQATLAMLGLVSSPASAEETGNTMAESPFDSIHNMPNLSSDACVEAVVFGVYAETAEQLEHVQHLVESIKEFGGRFAGTPVRLYVPAAFRPTVDSQAAVLESWGVCVLTTSAPAEAEWLFYAGKVFAAGQAEGELDGRTKILVWLDDDTIVLDEPKSFLLRDGVDFAYRPVTHNRSGSLWGEPPDEFWARIYALLGVTDADLFPVVTPADHQTIRAYFNAGLLVVRPEIGILRGWAESFRILYSDSMLASMCRADQTKRIFLHQAALVGPAVRKAARERMAELSAAYNYPIFFRRMFGATREFDTLDGVVTLRHDTYFRDPDPEWGQLLRGSAEKIEWLTARLGKK